MQGKRRRWLERVIEESARTAEIPSWRQVHAAHRVPRSTA
ncbi:hypothetical protein SAMN04488047_11330 [Tranquillimonas alkanivorans]|uniref:Transposase n=1 Tax=Tranquillimonas alkanivorans TaxID=441119 RepID=A0A1I5TBG6_9RHOB|nr:hypothetical protein SAMN04488047_11330 [Tranquillimonas alkanivorans]